MFVEQTFEAEKIFLEIGIFRLNLSFRQAGHSVLCHVVKRGDDDNLPSTLPACSPFRATWPRESQCSFDDALGIDVLPRGYYS